MVVGQSVAAENPDELYRQGRYGEAEEGYAQLDMDNPKDIRYRYNRGCAAYQNSDYQGALASFSSVLRRSENKEVLFKTTYNLGNIAYKLGDFESAAEYYRRAILYHPESEDARYNLELSLRELEKQQEDKDKEHTGKQPQESSQPGEEQGQQKSEESKPDTEKEQPSESTQGEDSTQSQADKSQAEAGDQEQTEKTSEPEPRNGQRNEEESTKDLAGELRPVRPLPEDQAEEETADPAMSTIDKKKAEALLDNIKEDRSRYLRFLVPQEKRRGVQSGKDW
jgi:Ca-activated chloride channel family protein